MKNFLFLFSITSFTLLSCSSPQSNLKTFKVKSVKNTVDLSGKFPSSRKQGTQQNSCQSFAISSVVTYLQAKKNNWKANEHLFSPAFIYDGSFLSSNNSKPYCLRGLPIDVALNNLKTIGIVEEKNLPYIENRCDRQKGVDLLIKNPNVIKYRYEFQKVIDKEKTLSYKKENIQYYLNQGKPIIISIKVPDSLNEQTTLLKNPIYSSKTISTHALVVVGYDDNDETFKVQNSWGDKSHINGFFKIDYATFSNTNSKTGLVLSGYIIN